MTSEAEVNVNQLLDRVGVPVETSVPAEPPKEPVAPAQPAEKPAEAPQAEKPAEKPAETPEKDPKTLAIQALHRELKGVKRELKATQERLTVVQQAPPAAPPLPPVSTQPIVFGEPDPLVTFQQAVNDPEALIPLKVQQEHEAWRDRKAAAEQSERDRQIAIRTQEEAKRQDDARRQQTEAETKRSQEQAYEALNTGALSEEKLGEGLGLDDMIELGYQFLTPDDRQALQVISRDKGADAMFKAAYAACVQRLGGPVARHSEQARMFRERYTAAYPKIPSAQAVAPANPTPPATPAPVKPTNEASNREEVLADAKKHKTGMAYLQRIGIFP